MEAVVGDEAAVSPGPKGDVERVDIRDPPLRGEVLAAKRGIAYVDTFDISLRAGTDRRLVADDGLHPSGAQYALWVERIAPVVEKLLRA